MRTGTLPVPPGGLDLRATLECGQTFLWERRSGETYGEDSPVAGRLSAAVGERGGPVAPDSPWYATTADGGAIHVRVDDGRLEWRATDAGPADVPGVLRHRLGLGMDLPAVLERAPADETVQRAIAASPGLRIVTEPFLPTLYSFICSAQMRVERIFRMVGALAERYGEPVELAGHTGHTVPDAATLAAAGEAELRSLKLGYRAPYVRDSAAMVADGRLGPDDVRGLAYEAAREAMTGFVGVGEKVADCVLLFSLSYREPVPLDTWIRTAIEEAFPDCARGSYADTSRAIRERFGTDIAGVIQTYVFHYLRTRDRATA